MRIDMFVRPVEEHNCRGKYTVVLIVSFYIALQGRPLVVLYTNLEQLFAGEDKPRDEF